MQSRRRRARSLRPLEERRRPSCRRRVVASAVPAGGEGARRAGGAAAVGAQLQRWQNHDTIDVTINSIDMMQYARIAVPEDKGRQ